MAGGRRAGGRLKNRKELVQRLKEQRAGKVFLAVQMQTQRTVLIESAKRIAHKLYHKKRVKTVAAAADHTQ